MFWTVPLYITRSFLLYTQQWHIADSLHLVGFIVGIFCMCSRSPVLTVLQGPYVCHLYQWCNMQLSKMDNMHAALLQLQGTWT